MSEPEASRRINAARLMKEFPEIEEKLNSGSLTLTAVAQAQSYFNREATTLEEKAEILGAIEGQSTRAVEKILIGHSSSPEVPKERVRVISEDRTELKFSVDKETLKNLEWLKEHWSHQMPGASFSELVKKMAVTLKEKLEKKPRRSASPAPESKRSRYTRASVKYEVRQRDKDCTYVDERTGQRCCSRHKLQFDHIIPFAMGGENTVENLRLRCHAHNQLHAIETYGPQVLKYASKQSEKLQQ